MRISKVELINFQIHENLTVYFHEGVNVFVGPSNKGKTAVIRAINWVVFNRPAGDAFRRWSSKQTSATISMSNGDCVTRLKSDTENAYVIKKDNKTKKLVAFGQNVPSEVSEILNLSPINFQNQLDSPFLVNDSAAEVARKLNEVANLQLIDTSLRKVNKVCRDSNQELTLYKRDLKAQQSSLKSYDWIEGADTKVAELEALSLSAVKLDSDLEFLQTILEELEKIEKNVVAKGTEVMVLGNLTSQLEEIVGVEKQETVMLLNITEMRRLLQELEGVEKGVREANKLIQTASKQYNEMMPDVCPLCESRIERKAQ